MTSVMCMKVSEWNGMSVMCMEVSEWNDMSVMCMEAAVLFVCKRNQILKQSSGQDGNEYMCSFSMKIAHFVPIGLQTWPPHAILVSDWSISKKSYPLKLLSYMNRNLVGSIYMYGRLCIKFPQSRMKGKRHRLSPLSLQFNYIYCL